MQAGIPAKPISNQQTGYAGLVLLLTVAFSALFAWFNLVQYNWLAPWFERTSSDTGWGIIQRLWLILPGFILVIRRPKQIGFQRGKMVQYRKMLLIMLAANLGVISAYLFITGATPYSGLDMAINEVITVPLVEEVFWRGIVFAGLAALLRRRLPAEKSAMLAGVFSGVCFGLLHASNALVGYPLVFVGLQTLNATVWGVVYGIARAKTDSIYPSIVMHAAMNLAVVLI